MAKERYESERNMSSAATTAIESHPNHPRRHHRHHHQRTNKSRGEESTQHQTEQGSIPATSKSPNSIDRIVSQTTWSPGNLSVPEDMQHSITGPFPVSPGGLETVNGAEVGPSWNKLAGLVVVFLLLGMCFFLWISMWSHLHHLEERQALHSSQLELLRQRISFLEFFIAENVTGDKDQEAFQERYLIWRLNWNPSERLLEWRQRLETIHNELKLSEEMIAKEITEEMRQSEAFTAPSVSTIEMHSNGTWFSMLITGLIGILVIGVCYIAILS